MLSVEKWPAGMALRWGEDPYWRGTYLGDMRVRCDRGTDGQPYNSAYAYTPEEIAELSPASYSDLGREPQEGELAVVVASTGAHDPGTICAMFGHEEYRVDNGVRFCAEPKWFAPIDRSIYEAARGEGTKVVAVTACTACEEPFSGSYADHRCPASYVRQHVERARKKEEADEMKVCRRRAEASKAYCESMRTITAAMDGLKPGAVVGACQKFVQRWLYRVAELSTDCGDCRPCLARAAEMEGAAEWEAEEASRCPSCGFRRSCRCGGGR